MLTKIVWIFFAGCACVTLVSADQLPLLPAIIHVSRNWYAMSTDPIGTTVTSVQKERGDQNVTFGLETKGPPVPFAINPHTGVVKVNDSLSDKENRSYLLWVTSFDGSITLRTEVLATITDPSGYRPHPTPPSFETLTLPTLPKHLTTKSPKTTKAPIQYEINDTSVDGRTTAVAQNPTKKSDGIRHDTNQIPKDTQDPKHNATEVPTVASDFPLAIIPPIAIGGLVIIVAAVIIFVCKKNKRGWVKNHIKSDTISENSIQKEEPVDEWEFPRHRLKMFNIVGEGAFGQVFRAQAVDIDGKKGEVTVAVKTLKKNASQEEKTDLLQELGLMKSLGTHPNVVRLIGCCTEKEPTLVIMEFVSLGKLQQFLRDSRAERHYGNTHADSKFLTSSDLTHFAYQVARGMDFLSSKGIIHRDLAARNVLITQERTCKVADFGFARDVTGTHVYERKSGGRLPIRWMAPESLYDDIFSVKSDVWSFGVLLWEIVTLGSTPYPGLSAGDVMQKVRDGHRLEKPEHCRRELYNIMYYCWEAEPTARPDFKEVVTMLERLLCTETDYIELERFPDHSYYNVQHLDGEKL